MHSLYIRHAFCFCFQGDCKGNRPSQHDVKGRMEFDYWALVLVMVKLKYLIPTVKKKKCYQLPF